MIFWILGILIAAYFIILFIMKRRNRTLERYYQYLRERQPQVYCLIPQFDPNRFLIAKQFVKEDFWDDYLVYTGKYEYVDDGDYEDADFEEIN